MRYDQAEITKNKKESLIKLIMYDFSLMYFYQSKIKVIKTYLFIAFIYLQHNKSIFIHGK